MSDLSKTHTWYLIRMLLLRANFAYNAGGVSGGRSPMSCVYDAWALAFSYEGGQMLDLDDLDLIAELAVRPPMWVNPKPRSVRALAALDEIELTALAVRGMKIGHAYMESVHSFPVRSASTVVSAVHRYVRTALSNAGLYLPETMFEGKNWMFNRPPQISALLETLKERAYRYVIVPDAGLIARPLEEK